MKNLKKSFVYFIALSTIFVGCSKDEIDNDTLNLNNDKEVLETFTSKLPENVTKIESVTSKHPLLIQSELISKNLTSNTSKNSSVNENAVYYFTNNNIASLSYNGQNVYATVFDSNGNAIDNLNADFSKVNSEQIVTINYIDRNEVQVINLNSTTNKSWGSCMDDAIDQLYDDWNDDPIGTFSCWVTGPLCAIGGGIACGIQQL